MGNAFAWAFLGLGRAHAPAQQKLSVSRLENYDFGITRHNNHYSSGDKLTRADPFYMRPRVGDTLNSVKYDIITNERRRGRVTSETPGYFADYGGSFQVSEDPAYPPNLVLKQGIAQKAGTNAWVSAAEPMTLIGHRLDDIVMSVDVFLPDFTQLPEMPERPGIQAAWDGQCLSTGGAAFGTSPPLLQESCEVKLQQSFILETSSGRLLAVETSSPQQSCLTAHRCDLSSPYADPGVCMRPCSHDQLEISAEEWHPDGSLRLQMHPNLCLTQGRDRQDRAHTAFVLADCGEPHALPTQRFLATGPMPIYTGLCVRLQPRARHEDPGHHDLESAPEPPLPLRPGIEALEVAGTTFHLPKKFHPLRALGKGTYGAVAAFRDAETGQEVAIKKIPNSWQNTTEAKRCLREIKLLKMLDHENVIELFEVIEPPCTVFNEVYLVTELCDADLHTVINSETPLSEDHVQFFIYHILRALLYLHSANVVHRDLKPMNVLAAWPSAQQIPICDFGLARGRAGFDHDDDDWLRTEYVGTRWYRAPEVVLTSTEYTAAVDMWSAGCILGELMGRKVMFKGGDFLDQIKTICSILGTPEEPRSQNLQIEHPPLWMSWPKPQTSSSISGHSFIPPWTREDSELSFIPPENSAARAFMKGRFERMPPQNFRVLYPDASESQCDLLAQLVQFDPNKRPNAQLALRHPYLDDLHDEDDEPVADGHVDWSFDEETEPDGLQRLDEQSGRTEPGLAANGTVLRVKIDDQDEVVAIHEEHTIGATALISGWHEAFYDNVAMEPPSSLEPVYY
eukprot:g19058.t1